MQISIKFKAWNWNNSNIKLNYKKLPFIYVIKSHLGMLPMSGCSIADAKEQTFYYVYKRIALTC